MNTYAYLRVSTEDQDYGVDAQRSAIERAGVRPTEFYTEKASGKNVEGRPVFQHVLEMVCEEQGTLVVAKLDRLGRSVVDVLGVFETVKECGASIKVIDMGIDTSTPAGQLMLTILAGFAQFEREMISQRTKEGLAAAKARGVQLGRPSDGYKHAIVEDLLTDRRMNLSVKQIAKEAGVSVRTVQRIKSRIA